MVVEDEKAVEVVSRIEASQESLQILTSGKSGGVGRRENDGDGWRCEIGR